MNDREGRAPQGEGYGPGETTEARLRRTVLETKLRHVEGYGEALEGLLRLQAQANKPGSVVSANEKRKIAQAIMGALDEGRPPEAPRVEVNLQTFEGLPAGLREKLLEAAEQGRRVARLTASAEVVKPKGGANGNGTT